MSRTFSFLTSNNQDEYEACIAGLLLAKDFNATKIDLPTDSLIVVSQTNDKYDAKDAILQCYLVKVIEMLKTFIQAKVKHVPQNKNTKVNILRNWQVPSPREHPQAGRGCKHNYPTRFEAQAPRGKGKLGYLTSL